MMSIGNSTIKFLFEPKSIAIIGVSANPGKVGHKILNNIIGSGYKGNIYPVNPKGGEILGMKVFPDLDSIAGSIDVAVIAFLIKIADLRKA